MNPYDVLEISQTTDDTAVRNAYIELIRNHPPELFPEEFQRISDAYEKLKDENSRLQYQVFNTETEIQSPIDVLTGISSRKKNRKPPNFENFKSFLRRTAGCL